MKANHFDWTRNPFHLLARSRTSMEVSATFIKQLTLSVQHKAHQTVLNSTYISVTFSPSCGASAGMLVIPSSSRHCSMAKEQRQAIGHPLRAGATRTRSNTTAGATLRSAMMGFEWVCSPGGNSTLQQELWTWWEVALLLASTQGYDPIQELSYWAV